jgi:hypothetical protein
MANLSKLEGFSKERMIFIGIKNDMVVDMETILFKTPKPQTLFVCLIVLFI